MFECLIAGFWTGIIIAVLWIICELLERTIGKKIESEGHYHPSTLVMKKIKESKPEDRIQNDQKIKPDKPAKTTPHERTDKCVLCGEVKKGLPSEIGFICLDCVTKNEKK